MNQIFPIYHQTAVPDQISIKGVSRTSHSVPHTARKTMQKELLVCALYSFYQLLTNVLISGRNFLLLKKNLLIVSGTLCTMKLLNTSC